MKKLIFIFLMFGGLNNDCLAQQGTSPYQSEKMQNVTLADKITPGKKRETDQGKDETYISRTEKRKLKREKRQVNRNNREKRVDYQVGFLLSGVEG